ncbi:MAG: AmmeMemoRadiSam system protein B [Candidatus Aenigmarchaeota archaeon]|nr:AmmeMemoRadiSam system protein B [Candidatus Aenigmarchaeota archaeon]
MFAIREPKAAGIFYNSDKKSLERDLDAAFGGKDGPGEAESEDPVAMITPHDKHHLCGSVSAWTYAKTGRTNYVIIGANHLDVGARFAIMKEGLWKTPLGEVAVSSRMAQKMIDKSKILEYDVMSHEGEHSVEVQLPFMQRMQGSEFKIVPIVIKNRFDDRDFMQQCVDLGKSIAQSLITEKERWVIIGTTDFTSGPRPKVEKADKSLIESMRTLNCKKFFDAVHSSESYICGYGAVLATMSAAKEMKAKKSRLLKYKASTESVKGGRATTGYASIMIR